MELKFKKSTDTAHEIKLDSHLISANWCHAAAYAGQKASFEIRTAFVGFGSPIEAVAKTESGKNLGKTKGKIKNNKFIGSFDIPDDIERGEEISFEVKLPKNNLNAVSERIPVYPPINVSGMKWSANEARRGNILTLSARVDGVDDSTDARVVIYEYDRDGVHDKIAQIPTVIKNQKLEIQWEYEYHEDTDEIPSEEELQKYGQNYNPPEYFFTAKIGEKEYGRNQESGLLTFKDWIQMELKDENGNPIPNKKYVLYLADGQKKEGSVDSNGFARIDGIPPGRFKIEFSNMDKV